MMQNWSNDNVQNICNNVSGAGGNWNLLGGGMMIVVLVLIVMAIYFVWKNGTGQHFNGKKSDLTNLSNLTNAELEAELNKRKTTAQLEAELADLKKQIAELKE
jgi:hypothetical protein